jgi:hypothetical protein
MPYLFTRSLKVAGGLLDSMAWAAKVTEKVNQIAEVRVNLWSPVMSPQINTLTWVTVVDDLAALTVTDEKLTADSGYLDLITEGERFTGGNGIDDSLHQLVHPDADAPADPAYATVVTAILAPGSFVDGVTVGVEIAQRAKAITGRATSFAVASTGVYGQVSWLALYDSIEQVQAADQALSADADFAKLLDEKASKAYLAGQSAQTISRRII